MKYLMIFYYYIIDKKIFCEKRVFYEKIGKTMSNIGYRSPFCQNGIRAKNKCACVCTRRTCFPLAQHEHARLLFLS